MPWGLWAVLGGNREAGSALIFYYQPLIDLSIQIKRQDELGIRWMGSNPAYATNWLPALDLGPTSQLPSLRLRILFYKVKEVYKQNSKVPSNSHVPWFFDYVSSVLPPRIDTEGTRE